MIAAALGALVGIFLVGIVETTETLHLHVPTTSENGSPPLVLAVNINNRADEIQFHIPIRKEVDQMRIFHVFHFPNSEMLRPKAVMSIRSEWSQRCVWRKIFDHNPAFDNRCFSVSFVDKKIKNVITISGNISYNKMRPMSGIELSTANLVKFDSGLGGLFRRISSNASINDPLTHVDQLPDEQEGLSAGDDRQQERKCRYGVCRRPLPRGFLFVMVGMWLLGGCIAGFGWWIVDSTWDSRQRRRKRDENHNRAKD